MGAATLTAGSVLTTIIETGSTITDFFNVFSAIKNIIDSHQGITEQVNAAINKALRKAHVDEGFFGRPNRPSNSELLDLILLKSVNKNPDIPHWFIGDEFDIFYNSLINDKAFWGILQELIQNNNDIQQIEELDNVDASLRKIINQIEKQDEQHSFQNEKLDIINETTKEIKKQIEQPKLPDGLIPYDVELSTNSATIFLQDAHENLIRENKIYRKKDTIETIADWLDTKGACLIIAPEGRGKTFLSRIIAFDYHENSTMVYFVDCRNESKSFFVDMKSLLFNWNNDRDQKYLLILENVHACTDPERLKQIIENQIRQEKITTNIKFLLNARPTIVDYDCFKDWKGKTIKLNPNENDVKEIVKLYQAVTNRNPFESEEKMMAFIKTISPNNNDSKGTNLRLLSIYLRTWQKNKEIQYVSCVTEEDIFDGFIEIYRLNDSLDRDAVLLFISSIFQFDAPIHSKAIKQFLNNENINNIFLLNNLVKEGLFVQTEDYYYLPHSVEAYFLFKAICYKQRKNHIDYTTESVLFYIDDFMLKQKRPRNYERVFKILMSGLASRKDEFEGLFKYLCSEDKAKEIIMNLNPGFVFFFFHVENHDDPNELSQLLSYYKRNKDWLTSSIREFSPAGLELIHLTFKNHLNYSRIIKDVFENPDDLCKYLARQFEINNNVTSPPRLFRRIKKIIESISPRHVAVIKRFYNRSYNFHKTKKYHFVAMEKNKSRILISNALINNEYCKYDKTRFQNFIADLCTQGFYIDEMTWSGLMVFLRKIVDSIDETHKESFQKVTKTLVQMVIDNDETFLENPNALENASSTKLSYFLCYLNVIDHALYCDTISNTKIIGIVKQKLGKVERMAFDDLYLFSRFYSQNWCKKTMDKVIDNADDDQIETIKRWYKKVKQGLDSRHITLDNASLVAYLQQKILFD